MSSPESMPKFEDKINEKIETGKPLFAIGDSAGIKVPTIMAKLEKGGRAKITDEMNGEIIEINDEEETAVVKFEYFTAIIPYSKLKQ